MEKIEIETKNDVRKKNPITNIFLISDIHIGVSRASEDWLENTKEYFEQFLIPLIKKEMNEGSVLLCLGDIFDDRKTINIAANNLAIEMFERLASILPVYIINGNHDMYNKTQNNIMSIRSLSNIPNLYMFKNPTIWKIGDNGENKWKRSCLMIPYQGDMEKETNIINQNSSADYTFLHSDIKNLRYDNGMSISLGVDTSATKGQIYSGHIHKRQEFENMVYVGSPFQMRRSDIGNQKGIYRLNLIDNSRNFFPNKISPLFVKIPIEQFFDSNDDEIEKIVRHNYVDIVVNNTETEKIKLGELYERLNVFCPKKISIVVGSEEERDPNCDYCEDEDSDNYKEKSMSDIIDSMIDELELEDHVKTELKSMNQTYQKLALSETA